MASQTMEMASGDCLSERLSRIKRDYQLSKDALHDWVAEQNRLIDEEERQIVLKEEAIDVNCDEPTDTSAVCASDETSFNILMAEADRLLLENSEGV